MSTWDEINGCLAAYEGSELAEWLECSAANSYKDGDVINLVDNGVKRPHFVKDAGNGTFELVPSRRVIGSRIAIARNAKGLKQDDLASSVGVHKQTVSRWERGKQTPSSEELIKIALSLECPSDFLLGLSDELKVAIRN